MLLTTWERVWEHPAVDRAVQLVGAVGVDYGGQVLARHGSIDAPMLNAPQVEHGELGERLKQRMIAATTMVRLIGRPEEIAAALRSSPPTTLLGTTQARPSPSRG